MLKPITFWALLLTCCVLINPVRGQETEPPATDKNATTQEQPPQDSPQEQVPPDSDHAQHEDSDWSQSDSGDTSIESQHHSKHHHHSGDGSSVSIGHNAELPAGQRADSVVAVFGSASSAGDVGDAVVSVLGNTRITGGQVGDSAVAVMGSVYVNGEVRGNIVAVFGNVELGPEAKVHDIVIIGGELHKDPAAIVDGHVQTVFSIDWDNFQWLRPWVDRCLLYGRPLAFADGLGWAWGIALTLLALYAFIAFVFRGAVEQCVHTFQTRPGHSILAALFTMLLMPVLFVLLLITVLGIAAIPFVAIGLILAGMFGKVVMLAFIGRSCTPHLAKDPVTHTVVGVLVGGAIVLVIYTIPVIGFIVYKLLGILGLGVVVYTLLLTLKAGRQARAAGGGPGPNSGPGGPNSGPGVGPNLARGPNPVSDIDPPTDVNFTPGVNPMPGGNHTPGVNSMPGSNHPGANPTPGANATFGANRAAFGGAEAQSAAADGTTAGNGGSGGRGFGPGGGAVGGAAGGAGLGGGGAGAGGTGHPTASVASLPRAGFGIRMAALLLDVVIVGVIVHGWHEGTRLEMILLATYGAVMWKLKGSTVGGIICNLRVMRLDGRPIDWPTAIVRALGCFLSLAVVGLGFLWIAIDSDRQAWHDKIAGTVVVRTPKGASLL